MPKARSAEGDSGDSIKTLLESVMTKLDQVLLCQGTFENRLSELEERVNKIGSPSGQAAHISTVSPVVPTMANVVQSNLTADTRMSFSHNLKIKDLIPKFDGKHGCPVVFLISIKRVITADTTYIQLYNILRSSLFNDAATWFSVVENTFSSFEEFELLFLSKFWSETEQDKIRSNLYMGKFNAQKGNSREQYFINRYATVRHLTPKLTEKEIIKHFSRHYDFEIHKTVIIQNITSFKDFCDILRQYDDLYKHKNSTPTQHQHDNYTPYYLRNFGPNSKNSNYHQNFNTHQNFNHTNNYQQNSSNQTNSYNRNYQQNSPQNFNRSNQQNFNQSQHKNRNFQPSNQNFTPHGNFKERNFQQRNACNNSRDLNAINVVADIHRGQEEPEHFL